MQELFGGVGGTGNKELGSVKKLVEGRGTGTAVPSLHFSSARGPARGAVVTRSHNPGSDVPAPVSVTQKNTF